MRFAPLTVQGVSPARRTILSEVMGNGTLEARVSTTIIPPRSLDESTKFSSIRGTTAAGRHRTDIGESAQRNSRRRTHRFSGQSSWSASYGSLSPGWAHDQQAGVIFMTHDQRPIDVFDTKYEMEDGKLFRPNSAGSQQPQYFLNTGN